ncbi:MAG: rhodanese-like domain-containing protein [Chitinophagaceae bacterium]|nr:MAG: rhodanese-like domain-containing protein [Chitinophagaceae bacterium]
MKNFLKAVAVAFVFIAPLSFAAEETPKKTETQVWKYKTQKLDRAQLDALLAHPEKLLVIDLRRPDELTKIGGLPVYLSIQSKELEKNLAYIPKDRSIITVSNHAGRAGSGGDLLTSKGFKVAGAVGVQDYEAEGGTLVKIAPPPPKTADIK